MSYIKCYKGKRIRGNTWEVHLWEDDGNHQTLEYDNVAYIEDEEHYTVKGLNGEKLRPTLDWRYSKNPKYSHKNTPNLHFHDMDIHQKFLIERYGTNDEPSKNHKELFFDIEIKIGGALTESYIESAPMPVTSIAWYYKQKNKWCILIWDEENKMQHKIDGNKEIIPCVSEKDLLGKFIEQIREIDPDILVGYNSDYFDIPYLYYRICNVYSKEIASYLSPINEVSCKKGNDYWYKDTYVEIVGVESLDYMKLHRKYSWKDEPSWKLDALGEKYVGLGKVDYEGNLNDLFKNDVNKFIDYNLRDVEIIIKLDEKLQYLALTKNIAHKGKHNYSEVYHNSVTQDGAISAYLLSQGIIPPNKETKPVKKHGYAGGYLFCPQAGLYNYMFDEDLTSLYPSIIMSLNIGKETFVARILDADDRNNRLGLNDLKEKDPNEELLIENHKGKTIYLTAKKLIEYIENNNFTIAANGSMFKTNRRSTLSVILNKWFQERKYYKGEMKKAYKSGDSEKGEYYHLMQYTMKILLNSTYGATALPTWRYGMNHAILSEAITLSGHRIIQESALCANKHINKIIKGEAVL